MSEDAYFFLNYPHGRLLPIQQNMSNITILFESVEAATKAFKTLKPMFANRFILESVSNVEQSTVFFGF